MRINNFLIKISNKLNMFFKKHFGDARGFQIIISIILSLFTSSFLYYYLVDFGIYPVISVTLISILFYVIYFIISKILIHLIFILKRVRAKNIAIYLILIYCIKYFYEETLYYVDIKYFEIIFIAATFVTIVLFSKSLISLTKNKKKQSIIFLLPSAALIISFIFFMIFPGFDSREIYSLDLEKNKIASKPESYKVEIIDYIANPIDLTDYVKYKGRTKKVRDFYFKKGLDETDVKGRIYAPKDLKNAPILFVVHGNHRITTKNYLGYDYLGKYLAKRGIAVASVDMNMLNGFLKFGVSNENDARAILLLENIKNLLERNNRKDSILYNRFDKNKIALLGHSRGAEAVAIAQNFNKLKIHPDNGNISHKYNFKISGIISVAGTYDQYRPSDKYLELENINYFAIAGTNDADIEGFESMLQYDNVKLNKNSDNFKAALYFGYGNHGNFNSLWQDFDIDPPEGLFINRKELLEEKDQQKILCIYTYNFLENSFGDVYNRELFKNGPYSYEDFPNTNYYSRYMDSGYENIADFEEDYDLLSASIDGAVSRFKNMKDIYEDSHQYGKSSSNSCAVFLDSKKESSYQIRLTEEKVFEGSILQFDIDNLENRDISELIEVELKDTWGNFSKISLKDYKNLTPKTRIYKYKIDYLTDNRINRYAPQSVRIQLEDFKKKNQNLNMDDLSKIEFHLKDNIKIAIDNIGITT